MHWLTLALKKYAVFSGRARRKEFWMFVLLFLIILVLASILDNIFGTTFKMSGISIGYGYLYVLATLALIIPSIAVNVRRLHDINKSGWYYLVNFIPFIGLIWMLIMVCTEGDKGDNQYGPDPKAEENAPATL